MKSHLHVYLGVAKNLRVRKPENQNLPSEQLLHPILVMLASQHTRVWTHTHTHTTLLGTPFPALQDEMQIPPITVIYVPYFAAPQHPPMSCHTPEPSLRLPLSPRMPGQNPNRHSRPKLNSIQISLDGKGAENTFCMSFS